MFDRAARVSDRTVDLSTCQHQKVLPDKAPVADGQREALAGASNQVCRIQQLIAQEQINSRVGCSPDCNKNLFPSVQP